MTELLIAEIQEAALRFLGAFSLFIVVLIISVRYSMRMERLLMISLLRGFIQLLVLSTILVFLFQLESIVWLFMILQVMIVFGAQTMANRIDLSGMFRIEYIALFASVNAVMALMTLLNVLPTDQPEFWIPIGGMVTGNSMNISYLTVNRFYNEMQTRKIEIEGALSLGATPLYLLTQLNITPEALKTSITPTSNNLRTLGLVFIPGLMTGLLIGGTHPIAAAFLQVMIFFLILGGGLLASVIALHLTTTKLFEKSDQRLLI